MTYRPLDCDLYDLIEVFCLRNYDLIIEMNNGAVLHATAVDTRTATDGEYLIVESANAKQEMRLDIITAITVATEGSKYGRITFGANTCAI